MFSRMRFENPDPRVPVAVRECFAMRSPRTGWDGTQFACALMGWLACIVCVAWLGSFPARAQSSAGYAATKPDRVPSVADGNLHACCWVSMDRLVAVGERGLILLSSDGGKQWNTVGERSGSTYYAVGFDATSPGQSSTNGLVVGGTIEPFQGRSAGSVAITRDAGQTWTAIKGHGLPRLIGLQSLGNRHWLAWGDWSSHWQSSLFETIDGGETWTPRSVPCGHLQGAAVSDDGTTVLVDRSSRVFFSRDGLEFTPLAIPSSPFHPLRFCRLTESGWWLGGDHGVLLHSQDGQTWSSVRLPGSELDHSLMSFSNLESRGDFVWVVGQPGNVVWRSTDAGRSWDVIPAHPSSEWSSISALNENLLVACGERGRVLLTRNRGQAWWNAHRSAERLSTLALVSTHRNVPWDVLTYVTHEGARRAGVVVVHDQHFGQALAHQPEWPERLSSTAAAMHLDIAKVLVGFPVGDLRSGIRPTDLAYYATPRSDTLQPANASERNSELVRQLVMLIRMHRPDVVVTEDVASSQPLEAATASAVQHAIQLAANPAYPLVSRESGIELPAWNVQRTLLRSTTGGGFSLVPTMLLKNAGMVLSDAMAPVHPLYDSDPYAKAPLQTRTTYRLANQRLSNIAQPLEGLILDAETLRVEPIRSKTKLSVVMASATAPQKIADLLKTRGSGVTIETAWDEALRTFVKSSTPTTAAESLWTIALESRRQGNWHRWHTALQLLSEMHPDGQYAEVAFSEWMQHFGSAEVQRAIAQQLAPMEAKPIGTEAQAESVSGNQTSPFATRDTQVAKVSHQRNLRWTPIARGRGTQEFSQLLSRWPDSWQTRKSEPAYAWLITSRARTHQWLKHGQEDDANETFFWPPYQASLSDWSGIHLQERQSIDHPAAIPVMPRITERPYLDGKDDEALWKQSLSMRLVTAWAGDTPGTEIRLCRDDAFLYVFCRCPKDRAAAQANDPNGRKRTASKTVNKPKQRDGISEFEDHVKLKIDIDRDYATWFEFGWDVQGETLDQCNDMRWWNPTWYVAQQNDADTWSTEIAIPVESLLGSPPEASESVVRGGGSRRRRRGVVVG
ncbi:MAG: YCF48-related protein [Pirellula sp.]